MLAMVVDAKVLFELLVFMKVLKFTRRKGRAALDSSASRRCFRFPVSGVAHDPSLLPVVLGKNPVEVGAASPVVDFRDPVCVAVEAAASRPDPGAVLGAAALHSLEPELQSSSHFGGHTRSAGLA